MVKNNNVERFINKIIAIHEKSVFPLGNLVITDLARMTYEAHSLDITDCLYRHATGNFGEIQQHELILNEEALKTGSGKIFSRYTSVLSDGHLVELNIITSANRDFTSVLLPHELIEIN